MQRIISNLKDCPCSKKNKVSLRRGGLSGTFRALRLAAMRGLVTTRHLLTHAALIVELFGARAYCRCLLLALLHPGRTTFLEGMRKSRS
jgi:hypothetical protein